MVGNQVFRTDFIQGGFKPMSEGHQIIKSECASPTFDRMNCPKYDVDGFAVGLPVVHFLKAVLQPLQKLFAFDEEGGFDFCHRI